VERLNSKFYYSQSSLGAYERCPKMFKYLYIDGISGITKPEIQEKIELGIAFHTLAERHFIGMEDYFYVKDSKLLNWVKILKEHFSKNLKYKSEFEIKQDKDGISMIAKYDLLVEEDDKIRIIDFKTNEKEYNLNLLEDNMQTKVYMFLLGENMKKIYPRRELEDITMEYFQLNFPESKIKIEYNEKKHKKNKLYIMKLLEKIEKSKKNHFVESVKNCEKCGFLNFCKKK